MFNIVRALVLSLLLGISLVSLSQTSSEDVVRSYLHQNLMPLISESLSQGAAERGESDDSLQVSAEHIMTEVATCLIRQLELLALQNNIDRTEFMDALAFSIHWDSDENFISHLKNSDVLKRGAEECILGVLELNGASLR